MIRTYITFTPIINGIKQHGTNCDQKVYPFDDKELAEKLSDFLKIYHSFVINLDDISAEDQNTHHIGIIRNLDSGHPDITIDLEVKFDKQYYLPSGNGYIVGSLDVKSSRLILNDCAGRIYDFDIVF